MRRRNKAYRIDAFIENNFDLPDNFLKGQFRMRPVVPAYLIILAIDTLHVAMRKENVANSLCAGDYRLLAAVG